MSGAFERTAVLVIRAWLEREDVPTPLRARITSTLDVEAQRPDERTLGAASEEEIVEAVRAWLRAFLSEE